MSDYQMARRVIQNVLLAHLVAHQSSSRATTAVPRCQCEATILFLTLWGIGLPTIRAAKRPVNSIEKCDLCVKAKFYWQSIILKVTP